jgi:hypothetical protein
VPQAVSLSPPECNCAGLAITTQSRQHRKENAMQLQDNFAAYRTCSWRGMLTAS